MGERQKNISLLQYLKSFMENKKDSPPSESLTKVQSYRSAKSAVSTLRGARKSQISFGDWHRRMLLDHEEEGRPVFRLWNWCYKGCYICRWFDSINYESKLCKCCFKFKTLKAIGTSFIIVIFIFIYVYAKVEDGTLPGSTMFFLFIMMASSYFVGFLMSLVGIPGMIGFLLTGFLFKNTPINYFLPYNKKFVHDFSWNVEKLFLLIAILRAGLLLNLARIKSSLKFIALIAFIPMISEFFIVASVTHTFFEFSADWSALQGSLLCLVSLATITSVMEKNRIKGYGEDKNLSTVLIAAAALSVIFGIFVNAVILSYVFLKVSNSKPPFLDLFVNLVEQVFIGLFVGIFSGILAGFFPDKHSENVSFLRILVVGIGCFSIATMCSYLNMQAAGLLGTITFCITASNMWEEIGWHEYDNPVHYFYSKIYYLAQPIALTLIGFSVDFLGVGIHQISLSLFVIFLGLSGKELACFLTTLGDMYPTNMKENLFICIAWFAKGTFQAVLVFAADHLVEKGTKNASEKELKLFTSKIKVIKETTVMAILIATPLANYGLTLLTPILLTKAPEYTPEPEFSEEPKV